MPFNPLDLLTSAIQRAVGLLTSLLGGFGSAIGAAITGTVAGLGALSAALKITTGEATALARSLSAMRAANGYSFGQGYDIQRRYGALGISQGDITSLFSQPGNNAFGFAARGVNPANLAGLAQQYQATANSGIFGRELANARLAGQFKGNVPDSLRTALSDFSPDQIRGAQAFSDRTNASLGVNPAVLKEYVTTLPLVQARITGIADAIKIKFAVETLPLVERVLGLVADYLAANADKIAATIRKVATWLVFELPIALLRFAANAAGAFSRFLDGMSAFTRGLISYIPGFLSGADAFINAIRNVGAMVAGVAAGIRKVLENMGIVPKSATPGVPTAAPSGSALSPAGNRASITPYTAQNTGSIPTGGSAILANIAGVAAMTAIGAGIGATTGGIALPVVGAIPGAVVGGVGGFLTGLAAVFGFGAAGRALKARGRAAQQRPATGGAASGGGLIPAAAAAAMGGGSPGGILGAFDGFGDAFTQGGNNWMANTSASNMAGNPSIQNMLARFLGGAADGEKGAAGMLARMEKGANGLADSWQAEMLKTMKGIEQRTAGTEKNTAKQERMEDMRQMAAMIQQFGARVAAYIAEDAALNQLRI